MTGPDQLVSVPNSPCGLGCQERRARSVGGDHPRTDGSHSDTGEQHRCACPARTCSDKALTIRTFPIAGPPQRPHREIAMHPHRFRREREWRGLTAWSVNNALVVEPTVC
jgi:hypothetical protein